MFASFTLFLFFPYFLWSDSHRRWFSSLTCIREQLCADLCCGGGVDAQVSTWQNPATVSPLQGKEWLQFRAPVPWLMILCVVFTHCIFPGADCKIGSFVKQGPAPSWYIVQPRPVGVHQWVSDSGARQSFLPSRLVSWPDQVTADRGWMPEWYRSQESLVIFVLNGFTLEVMIPIVGYWQALPGCFPSHGHCVPKSNVI